MKRDQIEVRHTPLDTGHIGPSTTNAPSLYKPLKLDFGLDPMVAVHGGPKFAPKIENRK